MRGRESPPELTACSLLGDHHVVLVQTGPPPQLTLVVVGVAVVAADQPEHGLALRGADTHGPARPVHSARLHGAALEAHARVVFWGWSRDRTLAIRMVSEYISAERF